MNCPNCGAAMELSAKGHYTCGHCGTNQYPEAVNRDGVRVLGSGDSPRTCPACAGRLVRAMVDDQQVAHCETCRGMLLPRRSFAEIVRVRRAWAESPPVVPIPPADLEMRRRIDCPRCGARMLVDRYYGPGNIILDRCVACDLVWLDHGELKQIIDAPGPDRGTRELS